jgi:hypothetical protein
MKKGYTKIDPKEAGLPIHLQIRYYPETTQEFLMFQIGEFVTRFEQYPLFDGENKVSGHRATGKLASVYHVQGWGTTLARAKAMFLRNQPPEDGQ